MRFSQHRLLILCLLVGHLTIFSAIVPSNNNESCVNTNLLLRQIHLVDVVVIDKNSSVLGLVSLGNNFIKVLLPLPRPTMPTKLPADTSTLTSSN